MKPSPRVEQLKGWCMGPNNMQNSASPSIALYPSLLLYISMGGPLSSLPRTMRLAGFFSLLFISLVGLQ